MHEHVFVITPEIVDNYPEAGTTRTSASTTPSPGLNELKAGGIDTIVDLTVIGLGRYIPRIQQINEQADINIVAATGLYTYNDVPHYFHFRGPGTMLDGPEIMVDMFVRDIEQGIADTGVKAGDPQVRHGRAGRHARGGAGAARRRPGPSGDGRSDLDPHPRADPPRASSSSTSSRPRAST